MSDVSRRPTEPTAHGTLAVLDPDDPGTSLRAVLQHPDAIDGDLHLLVVFPTAEYEARRRGRREAGVTAPYTVEHLETEARRIARRAGEEWLGSPDAFETMGAVGRTRDCVRSAVEELAVGRVCVAAPQRTRWQRLLGVEDFSADLARVLPGAVSVVPVDRTVGPIPDTLDADASGGVVLDPVPGAAPLDAESPDR